MTTPMLEVLGLQMHFPLKRSSLGRLQGQNTEAIRAVDGVHFALNSGTGKSILLARDGQLERRRRVWDLLEAVACES